MFCYFILIHAISPVFFSFFALLLKRNKYSFLHSIYVRICIRMAMPVPVSLDVHCTLTFSLRINSKFYHTVNILLHFFCTVHSHALYVCAPHVTLLIFAFLLPLLFSHSQVYPALVRCVFQAYLLILTSFLLCLCSIKENRKKGKNYTKKKM